MANTARDVSLVGSLRANLDVMIGFTAISAVSLQIVGNGRRSVKLLRGARKHGLGREKVGEDLEGVPPPSSGIRGSTALKFF